MLTLVHQQQLFHSSLTSSPTAINCTSFKSPQFLIIAHHLMCRDEWKETEIALSFQRCTFKRSTVMPSAKDIKCNSQWIRYFQETFINLTCNPTHVYLKVSLIVHIQVSVKRISAVLSKTMQTGQLING